MNQFVVFAGDKYYPEGGWHDFYDAFDTIEDANEAASKYVGKDKVHHWAHVVDIHNPSENVFNV